VGLGVAQARQPAQLNTDPRLNAPSSTTSPADQSHPVGGGMIEPYETPSNAAVREMWEEPGLHVELTRVVGVFGGELCSSTYSNGDRVAWVSTVFEARLLRGTLTPDGEETLEHDFSRDETLAVRCKPHTQLFLDAAYSPEKKTHFQRDLGAPRC
jgi:ADP-ribose pyrophosphatase YjhB (NUDIX family)